MSKKEVVKLRILNVIGLSFNTNKDVELILDKPYYIVEYVNKYGHNCETRLDKIELVHVELCTKEIRNKKLKEIFND